MSDRPTPETDAVWDDKSQNILEHARRLERERDAERALADRLHGVLDALDYLAFAENTAHGSLGEKITVMRAIALLAIEEWKEARSES